MNAALAVNPQIARCWREIKRYEADADDGTKQAWLVTLGIEDWLMEIRLIEAEEEI
jgi:hypothetical protein